MVQWYEMTTDGYDADDGFDAAGFYTPLIAAIRTPTLEHHTASDTLTKEETHSFHTNLGAGGTITLTLPQDAVTGTHFYFVVMAAQALRVDPGAAGGIYIGGAKQTDDKYISADDEAESVLLICTGSNDWVALFTTGTWSVEA